MGIQYNHRGGNACVFFDAVPEKKFHVIRMMFAYEQGNFFLPKKGKLHQ
jgi:hypothetical protein